MELIKVFEKYFNPATNDSSKVNTEKCEKCGGLCCKAMGCHISPLDLKEITFESIVSLIDESKCITIDWWNGNPNTSEASDEKAFYLRIKNKRAKTIDPSFGGICSILTDNKCSLSFEFRPKGGRELIPCDPECVIEYSKQDCAKEWYPYRDIMQEVYMHYLHKGDVTLNPFMFLTAWGEALKNATGED